VCFVRRNSPRGSTFNLEQRTTELCRSIDLTDLPAERIWGEMEKLLLSAQRPSIGLRWLRELGAVDQLFPELKALIDVPQEPEWHPKVTCGFIRC
jgi:tRNA nucleotidyltransferase (CCA-adding enzyme)